jgi:hypothetical protein
MGKEQEDYYRRMNDKLRKEEAASKASSRQQAADERSRKIDQRNENAREMWVNRGYSGKE